MLAIIKTGGKQYKVSEGDKIKVEKLAGEVGDVVTFAEVLLVGDEKKVAVGMPIVEKVTVKGKITEQDRHDKVWGIKFKAKKRYKLKFGHRQAYTEVQITKVA
jgi:large subunit ribosomal protein L21